MGIVGLLESSHIPEATFKGKIFGVFLASSLRLCAVYANSGFVHGSTECHPLRCRGSGKGRIGGERVAAKYGVAGAPKDGERIAVLHSETF